MRAVSSAKASSSSSSSLSWAGNPTLSISWKSDGTHVRSHPCRWEVPCSSGRLERRTVDYPSCLSFQFCPSADPKYSASEWREAYRIRCGRGIGWDTCGFSHDPTATHAASRIAYRRYTGPVNPLVEGYGPVVRGLPPITERSTFLVLERSLH